LKSPHGGKGGEGGVPFPRCKDSLKEVNAHGNGEKIMEVARKFGAAYSGQTGFQGHGKLKSTERYQSKRARGKPREKVERKSGFVSKGRSVNHMMGRCSQGMLVETKINTLPEQRGRNSDRPKGRTFISANKVGRV